MADISIGGQSQGVDEHEVDISTQFSDESSYVHLQNYAC